MTPDMTVAGPRERTGHQAKGHAMTLHTERHEGTSSDIASAAICDFCTVSPPVQSFACRAFIWPVARPIPIAILYRGPWAACTTCAPLVHAGSWEALATRVARLTGAPHTEIAGLFTQLTRHLTGTTVPFARQP